MSFPTISVVVPSYNQGRYLEETLLSILSQDYPPAEVFVMDGGSQDETLEVIKKYEDRITFWRSYKDNGQSGAIAEGFARATGDVLAWLNSDDYYEPGTLRQIAKVFADHRDAIMVYGDYFLLRQDGTKVLKRKVSCDFETMAYAYLMIPQPSAFWTRAAYEKVGGLDTEMLYAMDYDLFLRFAKFHQPRQIIHIKKALSSFRLHPGSKSVSRSSEFIQDWRKARLRYLPKHSDLGLKLRRYLYLLKVEGMYLIQRGYLPLRKDRTKA